MSTKNRAERRREQHPAIAACDARDAMGKIRRKDHGRALLLAERHHALIRELEQSAGVLFGLRKLHRDRELAAGGCVIGKVRVPAEVASARVVRDHEAVHDACYIKIELRVGQHESLPQLFKHPSIVFLQIDVIAEGMPITFDRIDQCVVHNGF